MNALSLASALSPPTLAHDADVALAVRRYCHRLGDDASTTQAAIVWATRTAGCTLARIRAGNRRADQLRDRLRRNAAGTEIPA